MHDARRAFSVDVVVYFFPIVLIKLKRENVFFFFLLSIELYDQILDVCLYSHTAFPPFFPFILCTSEMTDFYLNT